MSKNDTYLNRAAEEYLLVRERHDELREEQRRIIIEYLEKCGFTVIKRGGRGIRNYTAGGKLKRTHDLFHWKWVVVENGESWISITMQALDRNQNSRNYHALIDRLGYRVSRPDLTEDDTWRMIITEIELPMDEQKLRELAQIVKDEIGDRGEKSK